MKKNQKTIAWLLIFILLIILFVSAGTYAYLNIKDYYEGTFNVDIRSKGIDVFTFEKSRDVFIELNEYNFSRGVGHDVVAETIIAPTLETSNPTSKICYTLDMKLPDEQVFDYSYDDYHPELLLDIYYSTDGETYTKYMEQKDITITTGTIPIPTYQDLDNYKHEISTTKNIKKQVFYKVSITFVYYDYIDQSINNEKSYSASFNANVVEC